ncbi:MAG: sn-glycerol-3-phosphate ABC transporter ATP-binding protein UgpC [bacterium]
MADVKLTNVSKIYDGKNKVVHNVDLEINDREFVVLVGPSGCGKSTTLRMIAGLEEISEGEIYIDGKLVNNIPPKDRDIAMVFQNYALYPHMTVYENMAFGLKLRKIDKCEIKTRVNNSAKILGLEELLNRKPKQLSGGQRQRVALGRAIVRNPKVFLFDEPLSNLDAKLRVQMRGEISRIQRQLKTTAIYVTHDQVEAMTMGDRIVVMKDGFIQQIDTPINLYHKPVNKFVAGFIGNPSMNFIKGIIENGNGLVFKAEENLKIQVPQNYKYELAGYVNREIYLGIRPESIFELSQANQVAEQNELNFSVDLVEPLGNEAYVYLSNGSNKVIARFHSSTLPVIGDNLPVCFELAKLHFFECDTEKAI